MKNKPFLFLALFLLFPGILLGGFSWWKWAISPKDLNDKSEEMFVIPKGEGTEQIIRRLAYEGFIKSPLAFKIVLKKEGLAGKIQAGDFRLSPNMNAREIARELTHGTLDIWVTIPEGLRSEEIFQILKKEGFTLDFSAWQKAIKGNEGFLFPDTYLIPKQATSSTVVKIMRDNFDKKTEDLKMKLGEEEVILASLVEREAKFGKDRPIVGGILTKRLKNDWPLEVDATIQYAQATEKCGPPINSQRPTTDCWWPKVTRPDLEIESDYNTYKNKGLPPSPICNPGLASINATLFPKESEYWFYLSGKEGEIHYAKTLEDHEKNVERYLN